MIDNYGNLKEMFTLADFVGSVDNMFLFSHDKILLFISRSVSLYNLYTGECLRSFYHESNSPKEFLKINENEFIIRYDDNGIIKWHVNKCTPVSSYLDSYNPIYSIINITSSKEILAAIFGNQNWKYFALFHTKDKINLINSFQIKYSEFYSDFTVVDENELIICNDSNAYRVKFNEKEIETDFIFSEKDHIYKIEKLSKFYVAIVTTHHKNIINIWNIYTNTKVRAINLGDIGIKDIIRRTNQNLIVWTHRGILIVIDLETFENIQTFEDIKTFEILTYI